MAPARPIQALGVLALGALLVLSAPFQLWLGRGGALAARCFPHHLLPLRLLAKELRRDALDPLSPDLGSALAVYRAWFQTLDRLRNARVPLEDLRPSQGRVHLRLARGLIRFGQSQWAQWHLLEAARCLETAEELSSLAAVATEQRFWQALAAAAARLEALGRDSTALAPEDPASRAQLQRWLGQELWALGDEAGARKAWGRCADLGLASCHSALASILGARSPGLARQHHLRALELDPDHGPSLLALHAKEKKP